jgi:uncharacterized protein YjiS (DUF1127 family)
MASHVLNSAAGAHSGLFSERWADFKRHFQAWRAERRYRARIWRELMSYTDRELADIGLTRSDIPAVVNGTYRRR